ncbi:Polyribonucleotide nucleotidyltransferase [Labilithrix luteola]|uniref:Polyribonucleotide nucleotidyltransferase n=1 Tax=Labilithrix luteola TaxID=1391654 RepID=A0A0K1QB12_9BACT|nr:polyribonucleotide nucleotidyltransferase [Labilithrix luteola]AKV02605.1 Polyribonucleotide nucleotidyltransferase [Labilithrix luteola]
MSFVRESVMINGRPLTLETGRLAKQAHGSILISYGESVVLVTAVSGDERPGLDFFPLTCEYVEKTFAAGKIPGGFFKREGRLRDDEVLTSRLIDRPCRPLFPEGFKGDTQIIATVLSSDKINPTDVLALTGASAALHISDVPWAGPIVGVRVIRVNGEFIAFPTFEEQTNADIDMVVACSKDAIVMVEGGAAEASESDVIDALMFAQKAAQPVLELIEKLRAAVGKPKKPFEPKKLDEAIATRIAAVVDKPILEASLIKEKKKRYDAYKAAKDLMVSTLTSELGAEKFVENEKLIKGEFEERKYHVVRNYVLTEKKRIDGRDSKTIRPIAIEAGLLPRVHGSALFQRGETQAIVTATLGTSADEQKIDALTGERWKRFMLHYNFPPFSTGETKPLRGPGRREVGHGALAERALMRMIPEQEKFPYTIRVVSETLESNGSSSMAAVCGGTLSLMDAGVPVKAPVAGIAMGLITDGPVDQASTRFAILSDILGDEDHLGDMDFKVCGTAKGITAIQMDIKIAGLTRQVLQQALDQAREGRVHILGKMNEILAQARPELSKYAPRITTIKVKPDQIRLIIGPGGKTIKGIIDQTGVAIDVEDDGTVNVASSDSDAVKKALDIIKGITAEPEVGAIYKGSVQRVTDFGAFVEILPGTDGLLHISEMAHTRVERVTDVMKEGDEVEVKVIEVGRDGKIRLSRRELLPLPEGAEGEAAKARLMAAREGGAPPSRDRGGDRGGPRGGGDRGPRGGGDRGGPRGGGGGDRGPRGGGGGDRGPR